MIIRCFIGFDFPNDYPNEVNQLSNTLRLQQLSNSIGMINLVFSAKDIAPIKLIGLEDRPERVV